MKRFGNRWMGGLLMCLMSSVSVMAQSGAYPARPIKLVVPFPPGGGTDIVGRLIGERLQAALGQPVVVENRVGAGGTIGSAYVAQAKPDGYTVLLGISATMAMAPHLYPNARYADGQQLTALAQIGTTSSMLVVNPAFPAHNLNELLALAKASPARISYGSWGLGSGGHLCAEILMRNKGVQMTHVPYKGVAPELADVVGGTISVAMIDATTSAPYIRSGKLRALAACTERAINLPEVPGLRDEGVRFDSNFWYGLFAPSGTPQPAIARLRTELDRMLHDPAMLARLQELGIEGGKVPAAQFDEVVRRDYENWGKLIREANIRAE